LARHIPVASFPPFAHEVGGNLHWWYGIDFYSISSLHEQKLFIIKKVWDSLRFCIYRYWTCKVFLAY